MAQNGVQCDVCHMMDLSQQIENRGKGIAGFILSGARQGPIIDPVPNAFHASEFDRRYISSDFCNGCHDVLSPEGLQIENTSTEWDNSVYSGQEDRKLTLFAGTPFKNGHETLFFWEADSIANNTIAAFDRRSAAYTISKPFATANQVDVSVRLRFRSFPPYLLREIGLPHLIDQLEIFDMETYSQTIVISQ